jgi:hypothetical protein
LIKAKQREKIESENSWRQKNKSPGNMNNDGDNIKMHNETARDHL